MHTSSDLSSMLDKLTDSKFREQLLRSPIAALASIGVTLQPNQVPATLSLPSHASLAADQGEVRNKLESTAVMVPFLLSGNMT
ncbi:putative modified peptide [Pseudoduganella sp. FT55W]|uniref:Modified peptide n=1 Tax=Duganella rivi TaxID=2666083 RepID=A0A7X4KB21_9BURK|nr:NHLP-related RiPP peptide [Duganella rivi]MYM67671.1 putative modified peptide [Duganella rivi]